MGDTHIYTDHIDPLKEQIQRSPNPFPLLEFDFKEEKPVWDYKFEDFKLLGYNPHKTIKMKMAV